MNCSDCNHYIGPSVEGFEYIAHACRAFPYGIPHNLFHDPLQHNIPILGDNGFQFQAKIKDI
jgi:hypothetical protein